MEDAELERRLTKVEERAKSNTHQINELKPIVQEIHNLSRTMMVLVEQVKNTNESVEDIRDKVDAMETEPKKILIQTKMIVLTALATALIGGIVSAIFVLI